MKARKKLIEVALPLEAINVASGREKSIRHGHPSTLHLWWARRPLAAARAVLFAQVIDDPSSRPELFPTEEDQERERARLFSLIEKMVRWKSTTDEKLFKEIRREIREQWRRTCEDFRDHPRAAELFDPERLPAFHDPFAGGGSLPLEAQRLGLEAWASDLNPIAVLINRAMIEIPPRFAGRPPVNPEARGKEALTEARWAGAQGLAEDVRYYGRLLRDEAERKIGHLYPPVKITEEMARERPDLTPYVGQELPVVAWIWARTVRSPNPAFADVEVPLVSSFLISNKKGNEAWVEPIVEGKSYRFVVRVGTPPDSAEVKRGTKEARGASFRCLLSGVPITSEHVKTEGRAGRLGVRLLAIVVQTNGGKTYLSPQESHEEAAMEAEPSWMPVQQLPEDDTRNFWTTGYGLTTYSSLFSSRQLAALSTFAELIGRVIDRVREDAVAAGMADDGVPLREGGAGATAYAEAVATYLAFALDKCADYWSTIATWMPRGTIGHTFARQALPMTWDFPEANPFSDFHCAWLPATNWVAKVLEDGMAPSGVTGKALQRDATTQELSVGKVVSTDPPYYDNVGYADLSDFFYAWLRRSLREIYPDLFATVSVPKAEELVASPYRHGGKREAEEFFLDGMGRALRRLAEDAHPAFPVTIYYAFKQAESKEEGGVVSTGWETFLDAVIRAGFSITATWPMRTERSARALGIGTNALASSIVLVCRKRPEDAPRVLRQRFMEELRRELEGAIRELQRANIAPVDLAQAAIGPGMAVFSRYAAVLDSSGRTLSVGDALALVNETLDELLAEHEADLDADTRWAIAWFDEQGFAAGEFGRAETLCTAKNTSVAGLVEAGIVEARGGKVRLLRPKELPADWDPDRDARLTAWEVVHHLVRLMETGGEEAAADLVRRLGGRADGARELAYRLYGICERRQRAPEALAYNALVQSWPEIVRLAGGARQAELPGGEDR